MAKILVVDDDHLVCKAVTIALELNGHSALVAEGGLQGLKVLDGGIFDMALVDIFMPDIEGIEIVRTLKGRHPCLPVIVMSGGGEVHPVFGASTPPDYLGMAIALGADESLHKPFSPDQLIATVDACLARHAMDG